MISPSDWQRARWAWLDAVEEDTELPSSAKVLASALARRFADHISGKCFPGNAVLMKAIGAKSDDTVQRGFKALAARGWLKRTEGRGRGSMACCIFLMPAVSLRQTERRAHQEKTTHDHPKQQPDEAAGMRFYPNQKAADMRETTRRNAASRIEPNTIQKTRADADARRERPAPHLHITVLPGSEEAKEWDAWLCQHRRLPLIELACLVKGPQGQGHDVPWKRPPPDHDATGTRIALSIFDWQVDRLAVRHDR